MKTDIIKERYRTWMIAQINARQELLSLTNVPTLAELEKMSDNALRDRWSKLIGRGHHG